jgi:hypothetical protein
MKIARSASAARTPSVSAFFWCSTGTASVLMLNTNTLSTESLFSTM